MNLDSSHQLSALTELKKRWLVFSLAGFIALGSLFVLFIIISGPRFAAVWGSTATLGLSYLVWLLWHNLQKNHRPGEAYLLPSLGPGNTLTLVRGALLAFLGGFLFLPQPGSSLAWAPALIFTLVIAADFLDGYLARVSNHVTRLGETLDMSLDGIGILIAVLLAIQYGQLPIWYLVVALARYLFLAGMRFRSKSGYPVHDLPASVRRRAFAGLQMGFVSVMLWPVFSPPGTFLAALVFAIPFLLGFLLDWLVLSGFIQPSGSKRFTEANWLVTTGFPIAVRMLLLTGLILFSGDRFLHYTNRIPSTAALEFSSAVPLGLMIFVLETLVMVSLVLGSAGRIVSIAGLLLLGVDQSFGLLQPLQYLLIVIYISTIYLGTGPYSLWKPEDRLIFRKVGELNRVSIDSRSTAPFGD